MIKIIEKLKKFLFKVEHRVPHIPNFRSGGNILKVIFISLLISIIYTFTQIEQASMFYFKIWNSLQIFSPYAFTLLFFLMLFSSIFNKISSIKAILLMFFLALLSVYLVESIMIQEFFDLNDNIDDILHKFAIAIGLLAFFLAYFDWMEKSVHPSQLRAQLSFLQSKMRPHFLFNTLNSIMVLIKKEPELAKKMIINLSTLLRASLKENNNFMYTIKEELSLCEKYIEIEKIRMGDRLGVLIEADESILKYAIPKLSIQPLIENSILHGIQTLENGGSITLVIKRIENEIKITVTNPKNNTDYHFKKDSLHNNIGLLNLQERLKICFDGDVSFVTNSSKDFFSVAIKIPQIEVEGSI